MSKSIPDRWLQYKPYGTIIEGTNIIAFKVPLKQLICQNIAEEHRFTPEMLMRKFPNIKCIVDLTNTTRYYESQEFKVRGIEYVKIMIPGKQVPPIDGVHKFFAAMKTFNSTAKKDELIGVHCTHGINRTGYLICRYLIQQLGWQPQKSVQAFENARGYPIEREAYVKALMDVNGNKYSSTAHSQSSNESWRSESRRHPMGLGPMDPPYSGSLRRGYTDDRHYPPHPQQLYGAPSTPHTFRGLPSPVPPPPQPPSGKFYVDRSQGYGMPRMRPPLGPGPFGRFQPRMTGPPHMLGPSRFATPPSGPLYRSPGGRIPPSKVFVPEMPPPRMPRGGKPPPQPLPQGMPCAKNSNFRRSLDLLKGEIQGSSTLDRNIASVNKQGTNQCSAPSGRMPNDLDFTVDTFEENLTTTHQ